MQVGAMDNLLANPEAEEDTKGWSGFSAAVSDPEGGDGNCFVLDSAGSVLSSAHFPVDSAMTFELSARVAFGEPEKGGRVYVGLACFDAEKRRITSPEVHALPDTVTELTEAVEAGEQVLRLKDGAAWSAAVEEQPKLALRINGVVAFDVPAEGLDDLPNRNVSGPGLAVVSRDGIWEVELSKPLDRAWPAGTLVRLHYRAAAAPYARHADASSGWQGITGKFAPPVEGEGILRGHLWPGTKLVRFLLVSARHEGDPGKVYFDDLSLTALP